MKMTSFIKFSCIYYIRRGFSIEELTLYTIAQEKEIRELQIQNICLEDYNTKLEQQNKKLQELEKELQQIKIYIDRVR